MPTITFRRASNVQNIPITDGQIIFDTSRNIILMDNGNVRNQYAGATQLISTTPEATDTNAFNAQASTQLFLQKTTVIDTKANALAVNQNYIPLGCLAFKEALGTSNYSNIGNGTISGALVNLNNQLSINNTQFYFDYKNGQYGYNTSATRGADTFYPFKQSPVLLGTLGNTFNLSSYIGYQQFTSANFFIQPTSISATAGAASISRWTDGSGRDATMSDAWTTSGTATRSSFFSYNASTGVLTTTKSTSSTYVLHGRNKNDIYDIHEASAPVSVTLNGNVYLVR